MGECKMQQGFYKDAIQYFSAMCDNSSKKQKGWEALVRCLYKAEYFEEAMEQVTTALKISNGQAYIFVLPKRSTFCFRKNKRSHFTTGKCDEQSRQSW